MGALSFQNNQTIFEDEMKKTNKHRHCGISKSSLFNSKGDNLKVLNL